MKRKRIVKPGDIFRIDFENNLYSYFVVFKKRTATTTYGGFFKNREEIEVNDYRKMLKKLIFYGIIGCDGIRNGDWKFIENVKLPDDFKSPPMRLLTRKESDSDICATLNIFIVDPDTFKHYPSTDEDVDELEDCHLFCGYKTAEKRVLARLKGKSLRLTVSDIESDPNDLAIIKERRFAEAHDRFDYVEKYDDLRLLYKAINAYIKNNNDNIIPAFDSKSHNKALTGEWDPAVNREIKKALKRKWVYQTVSAVIGKNINEVDIYKPILEVKNAAYGKGLPRYVDKRGVILYDALKEEPGT